MSFPTMSSRRFFSQALFMAFLFTAVLSSFQALASQVGVVTPMAPSLSPQVVAWWSVTALVCTLIMNLTAPGTPTPWNWTPQVRFFVALGATTISGIAHALTDGTAWQTAVLTAFSSLVAAVLAQRALLDRRGCLALGAEQPGSMVVDGVDAVDLGVAHRCLSSDAR